MCLQFRANFADRYIEMRMRLVHLSMRTEGIKAFLKRIRRCRVDGQKRYENDKCGRKSFWKRSKTAPFSFENGLVWTGPEFIEFHRWEKAGCFIHVLNLIQHVVLYYLADTFYWSRPKKNLNTLRYTKSCCRDSLFTIYQNGFDTGLKNARGSVKTNVFPLEERSDRQTSVLIGAPIPPLSPV